MDRIRNVFSREAMFISNLKVALGLFITFGFATAALSQETYFQTGSSASQPSVAELMHRMDAMQRELDHLRRQKELDQASTLNRFQYPSHLRTDTQVQPNNGVTQTPCTDSGTCDSCGRLGICGACEMCQQPAPCIECPHVSTANPYFNVKVFGSLKMDMLWSDARAISPGTPYYLLPGSASGLSQNTSDFHARQSFIGVNFEGPTIGDFQAGGLVQTFFYNDNALADAYGILPLQIYGDLRNEYWRFAAGYQFDVFNPSGPTVLPFSGLCGSGNAGNASRGQVRIERFIRWSDDARCTCQFALSEPITSLIDPAFRISEDNGWPNLEARIGFGLGCMAEGAVTSPVEIGFSGVVGEVRNTVFDANNLAINRFVGDVWGLGVDFRWSPAQTHGFLGEFYTGQGLGTYNGAVLQLVNPDNNFNTIRSTGGWFEFFAYVTPRIHCHTGYGFDDPVDSDIPTTAQFLGRTRNSTLYGNTLFDVTESLRLGFELSWRETSYLNAIAPDNEGIFFHTQIAWNF